MIPTNSFFLTPERPNKEWNVWKAFMGKAKKVSLEAPVQTSKESCFALPMEDALLNLAKAVWSSRAATQLSADFLRQLLPPVLHFILNWTETKDFIIKADMSETNCKGAESTETQTEKYYTDTSQITVSKN